MFSHVRVEHRFKIRTLLVLLFQTRKREKKWKCGTSLWFVCVYNNSVASACISVAVCHTQAVVGGFWNSCCCCRDLIACCCRCCCYSVRVFVSAHFCKSILILFSFFFWKLCTARNDMDRNFSSQFHSNIDLYATDLDQLHHKGQWPVLKDWVEIWMRVSLTHLGVLHLHGLCLVTTTNLSPHFVLYLEHAVHDPHLGQIRGVQAIHSWRCSTPRCAWATRKINSS
jgi:hypothetical protein